VGREGREGGREGRREEGREVRYIMTMFIVCTDHEAFKLC